MTKFIAVEGSSIYDVCLNTYGTLNLLGKLMADNNYPGVEVYPTAGQEFLFDETLVENDQTFKTTALSGEKYATKRRIAPVIPGPDYIQITTVVDGNEVVDWTISGPAIFAASVDWGDGTTDTLTGSAGYVSITHNYASNGSYVAKLNLANVDDIDNLDFSSGSCQISAVSRLEKLTALVTLDLSNNLLTAFNPASSLPSTLENLLLTNNLLTAFNPTIALPAGLKTLYLNQNSLNTFNPTIALPAGLLTLDIVGNALTAFNPTIALPSGLTVLHLAGNSIAAFNPATALPTGVADLYLQNNALNVSSVNATLVALDATGFSAGVFALQGQSPAAAPTGAGATAKANLIGRGCTVTTD